jgi:integrase
LARAERISDLTPAAVQQAVADLRLGRGVPEPNTDLEKKPKRPKQPWSLTTCNHGLRAAKEFSRWLYRERRAREYVLEPLEAFNADEDPRHERRDLSDNELAKLISITKGRDLRGGMKGEDRAALYLVAAATGYRRKELKSLTPESFDLDAEPPTIRVEASHTKAGREDVQPIPQDTAEYLRTWLEKKPAGRGALRICPATRLERCVGTCRPRRFPTKSVERCSISTPSEAPTSAALSGRAHP